MWLVIIIILDGFLRSYMEIFFQQKLWFPPKTLASNITMSEPIQDNDNYKPHAKNYSNPSSVTADSRYFYIPHRYRGEGITIYIIKYGGSRECCIKYTSSKRIRTHNISGDVHWLHR
jgi:hypothetical protein